MRKDYSLRYPLFISCFLLLIFGGTLAAARQLPPADLLSTTQAHLLRQKSITDDEFASFAAACIRQKQTDLLMDTYRYAIEKRLKKFTLADLAFLYVLHDGIDSAHPAENSFYICFYTDKILVKYHVDNITPASYCRQAIAIAAKMQDNCLLLKGYGALSSYYSNVKHDLLKTNETLNSIDSLVKKNKQAGITSDCGTDVNIGYSVLYFYLGDNEKAITYLNRSIDETRHNDKPLRLYDLYIRRSLFESDEARYPTALQSLDSASRCIAHIPDQKALLNNLYADSFNIYIRLNDFSKAASLRKKVDIDSLDVANDEYYDYLYNLIKLNIHNADYKQAAANISSFTASLKDWNIQRWKNAYEVKYQLSKAEGNPADALKYYEAYNSYNDSVYHQKQNFAALAQEIKYENQQKQRELNLQISLLQKQQQVDRLYLLIMIGVLATAALLVCFVLLGYRKDKRNIRALTGLNNEIESQKAALEKSNKEKDRILNIVAHDLRSPISGVYTLTDSMLQDSSTGPAIGRPLQIIKNAAQNALALISELLGYRKQTLEKINKSNIDLPPFIEETIRLLQLKAGEKQQKLSAHLPSSPLMANLDKEKIARVLNNLIGNAIKFSHPGTVIYIFAEHINGHIRIAIKDSGIGIPESMKPELFDMFTTTQRSGTSGEKSYGLGLSISRQIVALHNGRIWFDSEEDAGTTFFIEFPAQA